MGREPSAAVQPIRLWLRRGFCEDTELGEAPLRRASNWFTERAEPMPQIQLPIFPEGVTDITALLAFSKQDGRVTYFNGTMPVFVHDEADRASFQMITAQFCVNGNAKQADIVRAFGVTKISVKRAVKRYREEGPRGFYTPRKRRGPAVLTPAVLAEAQPLLDEGLEPAEVADLLGIKRNTFSKAVRAGRLHKPVKKTHSS